MFYYNFIINFFILQKELYRTKGFFIYIPLKIFRYTKKLYKFKKNLLPGYKNYIIKVLNLFFEYKSSKFFSKKKLEPFKNSSTHSMNMSELEKPHKNNKSQINNQNNEWNIRDLDD